MTRCPPSLRRLLQGAVRLPHRYCGDTPTPAAPPALLEDVGRYHGGAWHFAPAHRRRSAGRPGGLGSAPPLGRQGIRGGRQVSQVPGEPSWWPARFLDPGRTGHARPLRRAAAAPACVKDVGSCDEMLSGLDHPARPPRCLRFAAGVSPGPRKTRFRLLAGLYRAGLATRRVPTKGFRVAIVTSHPPFPTLPGAMTPNSFTGARVSSEFRWFLRVARWGQRLVSGRKGMTGSTLS